MKTEIDQKGIMTIKPETGVEAYALRRWCEENCLHDGVITIEKMLISATVEQGASNEQSKANT